MFERYTERARRVLFFARYEASQLGSVGINSDHLLLGLIRDGKGVAGRVFAESHVSLEGLRKEVESRAVLREKVPTSVEMPFSEDAKQVLERAAFEADGLGHNYIGTEHLLLGILRDERSPAGALLLQKGMRIDAARDAVVRLLKEGGTHERHERTWVAIAWKSSPCCFCGETVLEASSAVLLQISPVTGEGGSQNLCAHRRCLRSRVRADVPLITDAADQSSPEP